MKRELLFVFVFCVLVLSLSLTSTSNKCKQMRRVSVTPTSSAWCETPLRAMFNERDRYINQPPSYRRKTPAWDLFPVFPWLRNWHNKKTWEGKKGTTKHRKMTSIVSESFSARPSEKRCWKRWVWHSKTWRRCSRRRRCWRRNRYENQFASHYISRYPLLWFSRGVM